MEEVVEIADATALSHDLFEFRIWTKIPRGVGDAELITALVIKAKGS